MAASLVGYWPGETVISAASVSGSEERAISGTKSIIQKSSRVFIGAADWPLYSVSESIRSDEVYYDAPEAPVVVPPKMLCVSGSSNVSRFEPVLRDSNETENIEWRKFQPPKELFDVPYGTPLEIESIIIASVETIRQQLAEEESSQENAEITPAREESGAEQEIPVVEVTSPTGGSELLAVSNA